MAHATEAAALTHNTSDMYHQAAMRTSFIVGHHRRPMHVAKRAMPRPRHPTAQIVVHASVSDMMPSVACIAIQRRNAFDVFSSRVRGRFCTPSCANVVSQAEFVICLA